MKQLSLRLAAFVAGISFIVSSHAQTENIAPEIVPQSVLDVMQHVADWQLANPSAHKTTEWTQGAGYAGMMALAGISGDTKYRDAMLAMAATNEWKPGPRRYHADDQCVGQTYAELYFLWRDPKMLAPLRERFDDILEHPSAAPNLDFKQPDRKALELWSWCDSLFMAPPAWVRLSAVTGDTKYMDFAVKNWWRTSDFLYDKDEHLFFRDSTYFKKTEANGKKVFWSRGNGWVMGGLVRVLQYLPMNHPDRPRFEQQFADMAAAVLKCQQPDGLWRASLLDPDSYPLKETSGSGFYTYALAWGVNQGLLDRTQYEPAVRKAWAALVGCVDTDGKLTHVQPVGADPKKFDESGTEVYGTGAFLLAGSEVYRMAVLETARERMIVPIQFNDAQLFVAIEALANSNILNIKYVFDPKLGDKKETLISFGPTNCTAEQAFYTILDNNGLQLVGNFETGISLITSKNNNLKKEFARGVIGWPGAHIVKITNPANFQREDETIEINFTDLDCPTNVYLAVVDSLSSHILDSQIYTTVPLQKELEKPVPQVDMLTGKIKLSISPQELPQQKLLFQVDLAPNETRTFYILDATALAAVPQPIVKTFARYVPERYDDFAWESDRIAHRAYGLALIPAENTISSAPDVWIKKDRRLIVDVMYATKHYHDDNGEFMDDYRVGHSRGCGGVGIWDGKKLYTSSNYHNWKLITTGPIRSEFELTYDAWDAGGGRMVSETKRYSIDAGSWFTKAESTFASDDKSPLTVGVGLAERACPTNREEFYNQDKDKGWLSYWQPEDKPKGIIGDAIVLAQGSVLALTNDAPDLPDSKLYANVPQPTHEGYPPIRDQLAITKAEVGQPLTYYFGACWDRSGDFTNHLQWEAYVKRFAERRDAPLQVSVGN
ncbi:MAG TPA: glycoside hydrolase family 88 protein [Candidatus Sulfotelmatobacter sp.]|jgi:rhamnogalacturonyl hydrolase YesR|nr:glycoside hydrolase family 88 protein [Candidatus Sulfotelmatobacter sp.]